MICVAFSRNRAFFMRLTTRTYLSYSARGRAFAGFTRGARVRVELASHARRASYGRARVARVTCSSPPQTIPNSGNMFPEISTLARVAPVGAGGRARGASARRAAATAALGSTGAGAGSAAAVGRAGASHVGSGGGELVAGSDAHGESVLSQRQPIRVYRFLRDANFKYYFVHQVF